ncbi:hypothetical protein MTBLM1_90064 [Rhodospirillaceae bacterium LM-1]|nr:hypothetical protein MTBLM1_90064 [Rhodospirillaceae bacterium LM-1]
MVRLSNTGAHGYRRERSIVRYGCVGLASGPEGVLTGKGVQQSAPSSPAKREKSVRFQCNRIWRAMGDEGGNTFLVETEL